MAQYRAKVTRKGQVTIPAAVRRRMGLMPGDELALDVGAGDIRLTPAPPNFLALEGRWRQGAGISPDAVDAWLRELRGHEEV